MPGKDAERMVVVAQFAGPHGVRGDFKLRSYTEEPEAVFAYGPLCAEGAAPLSVKKVRELKPGLFLCRSESIGAPEDCADYKGALFRVPRAILPEADEDDFYIEDLIGLEARTEAGTVLGKVQSVPNYGAGDIVEIRGQKGFVLVPFTKDAVPEIDVNAGFIRVVPPEDDPEMPKGEDR